MVTKVCAGVLYINYMNSFNNDDDDVGKVKGLHIHYIYWSVYPVYIRGHPSPPLFLYTSYTHSNRVQDEGRSGHT